MGPLAEVVAKTSVVSVLFRGLRWDGLAFAESRQIVFFSLSAFAENGHIDPTGVIACL